MMKQSTVFVPCNETSTSSKDKCLSEMCNIISIEDALPHHWLEFNETVQEELTIWNIATSVIPLFTLAYRFRLLWCHHKMWATLGSKVPRIENNGEEDD